MPICLQATKLEWMILTKTKWLAKLKIFTIWIFTEKSLPTLVLHMGRDFSQFHVPNHLWHFKIYFKNCIVISMGWLILWYVPFSQYPGLKKKNECILYGCSMFLNISEDTRRIFKRRILLFKSSLCTYLALSVGFLQISGLYLYLLMKKKNEAMETRQGFLCICTGHVAWATYYSKWSPNTKMKMTSLSRANTHTICSSSSHTL